MPATSFAELLTAPLEPEPLVRRGLALLEAHFRGLALLALADWESLDLPRPELFRAVAALQRPSWGHWNGLLTALREARKAVLRRGSAAERERLARAGTVAALLDWLDEDAGQPLVAAVKPLAEAVNVRPAARPRIGDVLALPISLRNLVAHLAPVEADWWRRAAAALRPLLHALAAGQLREPVAAPVAPPAPWFRGPAAFTGVHGDTVLYALPTGEPVADADALGPVLRAFQRLLGRTDLQEASLRKLLERLAPEDLKGVLLGDYLVGRPVGQGGFATVHVGTQLSTGRKVAVKILHDGMTEADRARFQQEAAFLSNLSHPNIVTVLGHGEEAWAPPRDVALAQALAGEEWYRKFKDSAPVKSFLVMEWIDGRTLEEVYQEKQDREVREVAGWFALAAGALTTVHAAGLIHRDVKPSNLMLTDESQVKLMDFGIARRQDDVRTIRTTTGRVLGTPAYAPPEQLAARSPDTEVGPACDIYSLCASFYELFTSRRVFNHSPETAGEVELLKLAGARPERPAQTVRGLPWEIDTIVMGGLEPGPVERYRSMADLERDVRHFLRDEPIEYRPPTLARRLRLWYRRNPVVARLAAFVSFLLVAGAIASTVAAFVINEARGRAETNADNARTSLLAETAAKQLAQTKTEDALKAAAEETKAKRQAQEQRGIAEEQRDKAEWEGYRGVVGLTMTAFTDNNLAHATDLHDICQWNLRGWEHDYLTTLLYHRGQQVLRGHRDTVNAVSYDPDGTRLVSGGPDGKVCMWDARTGKLLRTLDAPEGSGERPEAVAAVVFTSSGKRILAATDSGKVRVWNAETGAVMYTRKDDLEGRRFEDFPKATSLSPDGKLLMGFTNIVSFFGQPVRVWQATGGRELYTLRAGEGGINGGTEMATLMCFSPDGDRIATAGPEGVKVWDASSGELKKTVVQTKRRDYLTGSSYTALCFGPDGKYLLSASFDTLQLWRIDGELDLPPATFKVKDAGIIHSATFSADGKQLAFATGDGMVQVWPLTKDATELVFRGHTREVKTLTFNPSGKQLASAGEDGTIRLWDLQARQEGAAYTVPKSFGKNEVVSFSPDGRYLAYSPWGDAVEVRDLEKGSTLATFGETKKPVTAVCFAPGGRLIAAADEDGTVLIWDAERRKTTATLRVEGTHVTALAFDARDERLAGGDDTGVIRVWTLGKDDKPVVLKGHTAQVTALCFSGDGTRLAAGSWDRTAQVWDLVKGGEPLVLRGHSDSVTAVCFDRDGKRLATGGIDTLVCLWDLDRAEEPRFVLKGHAGTVAAVRFSPDGRRLFSAGDRTVRVWDVQGGKEAFVLKGHSSKVAALWLEADGRRLASVGVGGEVFVWDASQRRNELSLKGHAGWVHAVCYDPTGKYLASAGGDYTVRIWDAVKGRELIRFTGHTDRVIAVAFDRDGERVAAGGDDRSVRVWDVEERKELCKLTHAEGVRGVCFSPAGDVLATSDGTVRLWDLAHPEKEIRTLEGNTGTIYGIAFSPDGKRLAGAGGDGTVWVWEDLETGRDPIALKGHTEAVHAVCFSPDGKRLASASWDHTVKVWELGKEEAVLTLAGHSERVTGVSFSADGTRVAASGADRTVRVWDAAAGGEPVTFQEHAKGVNGVCFAPAGRRIASAGDDGLVIVREDRAAAPRKSGQ